MSSVSANAKSAVMWNAAFNLFRDLLQFGTMLVLVRLLEPGSYGEFALVSSVMGVLAVFSHNSFIAHLLQVRDEADARYQDHFTASAVIQGAMFVVANLCALALRWLPDYAPITPYLHVMSLTFLFEWPCELRRKMLERQFDWKRLRLIHASGLIAGAILSIVLAATGAGTFALVVPALVPALPFVVDLLLVRRWRPDWSWSWQSYRPAFEFGLTRIGSGILVSSRTLVESGVISSLLGMTALGYFVRATGLAQMFCQKFASQLVYAVYPLLTRTDPASEQSSRINGLLLRLVAWVSVPVAAALAFLSDPVVRLLYGSKWESVIPLLPFAVAGGAAAAIAATAYSLLLSRHKTRWCMTIDGSALTGAAVIALTTVPHGLRSYVLATALLQWTLALASLYLLRRSEALSKNAATTALVPAVVCSLVAGSIGYLALTTWAATWTPMTAILVLGGMFTLAYLVLLRLFFKSAISELVAHVPGRQWISRLLMLEP